MKTRASSGSTLSLIIACTLVVALLGIAFVFMGFIFGGHREAQHAADAGSLNVAKRAIMAPFVSESTLTSSDIGKILSGALDQTGTKGYGTGVNLLTFNRLVAQAMVVAMNAEADGGPEGLKNATDVYNKVEGAADSVGADLKRLLSDPQGAWANTYYSEVNSNILRMLNSQGAPQFDSSQFQVAWMNQRSQDFNSCNVDISMYKTGHALADPDINPIKTTSFDDTGTDDVTRDTMPDSAFADPLTSGNVCLKGYSPIRVAGMDFYALPNNPGQQPHLESTSIFPTESTQPGAGTVHLPPNAFKIGGFSEMIVHQDPFMQHANAAKSRAHVVSVSIIGVPNISPFEFQIPSGYIVIDNTGVATASPKTYSDGVAAKTYSGSLANTNNVAAQELGTGIVVDPATKMFAFGSGPAGPDKVVTPGKPDELSQANLVDRWQAFEHTPGTPQDETKCPPWKDTREAASETDMVNGRAGLYKKDGSPVTTSLEASAIPFVSNLNTKAAATLCTDNNSSSPGGKDVCMELANGSDTQLSPFDTAYHPDSLSTPGGSVSGALITASEMSQCKVIELYGPTARGGGPQAIYPAQRFGPTGIRLYPNQGLPSKSNQYPWLPPAGQGFGGSQDASQIAENASNGVSVTPTPNSTPCQVTQDGSLKALLAQMELDPSENATPQKSKNFNKKLIDFLVQRAKQIEPKASRTSILSLLDTPIPLGATMYIYSKNGALAMDTTGPAFVQTIQDKTTAFKADGTTKSYEIKYSITEGMANPFFAYGIHDRLFTTWGTDDGTRANMEGDINAVDRVEFTPSSGAFGLLGVVKLQETSELAAGSNLGFNNRD